MQTVHGAAPSSSTAIHKAAQANVASPVQLVASSAAVQPSDVGSAVATRTLNPTREVFGFATSGSLADPTVGYPSWNFDLLSTVAFFAIHVDYQGVLIADSNWTVWNSSALTGLVATAHAHGVKVVVTLVGPGDATDQCNALYQADTTVLQIVRQVTAMGIDGVNIDYEGQLFQCVVTNPGLTPQSNQALLTNFARLMRIGLDNARAGYYLSIDTYSGSGAGNDGRYNIPDLNKWVDSFFVMTYDMDYGNQDWVPLNCVCLSPVSPLTNYYYNDTTSMAQYSAVVPAGKIILGQPYYGRVACVASPVAHAAPTTARTAATYLDAAAAASSPDIRAGTYVVHRDANDPTGVDRWDTWYDNSWGCWREMYWSDASTLAARYDLVNQDNLRGVGFWTLNYGGGSSELWSTLQSHFVTCATAGLSGNPGPPQLSGTHVQLVATSTNCNVPLYEFWMLPPGGTWTLVQTYTSSPNFYWNTLGKPAGTYRFSVWARAANTSGRYGSAPNTYDAFSAFDYPLTTSPCSAMAVTSSPAATATVGTQVAITGAATGCPNPLYQFWIQAPGGGWTVAQAYSTSATFSWNSTGNGAGSYRFSVWARDNSSLGTAGSTPNTYDAFAAAQYALTYPNCSALSASPTPASTANVGTAITVTGSATGCPNPLYQFWVLPAGGTWVVAQPYSSSATLAWNTIGKPAGSYRFSVWARDANSPNVYDSFSAFQYTLTTSPCTAMTATAAPPSTANVGTTVTVTGSASGCPVPLYQFWVLPPGGAWAVAQAYSTSPTFTWNTSGKAAGSYRLSVWARDAGSSSAYESFSGFQYTLTLAPCTAMSATTAPPSTATVGTTVTITASATGCPSVLYEFWMLAPGGTWTLVQAYSTNATLTWNTAGRAAGTYRFSVWARDASSSASYDAFSAFNYTLT